MPKQKKRKFKIKYENLGNIENIKDLPLEVQCEEINARLYMLKQAARQGLNGVHISELTVNMAGIEFFPVEILSGIVGSTNEETLKEINETHIATFHAMNETHDQGFAFTQEDVTTLLTALRELSKKHGLHVQLERGKKIVD